jgi:spore germination protein KA
LEENIAWIKGLFGEDKTVKLHRLQPQTVGGIRCCLVFVDGMVDSIRINECMIQPISALQAPPPAGVALIDYLQQQVLQVNETQKEAEKEALLHSLLYGDTLLFVDGCKKALILGSKGFAKRGISEPAGETYLKGPREGFVESAVMNVALLRKRLMTERLCVERTTVGSLSPTEVYIIYIDGIADKKVIERIRRRLSKIELPTCIDSG